MKFSQLSTQFLLLGAASALVPHPRSEDVGTIQWGKCNETIASLTKVPLTCANLPVPLDYTNETNGITIGLDLIKVQATRKPVKGTILFNFGGPGDDGNANLANRAKSLLDVTGGHYNLLSFDPRGTGDTLTFSCYDTDDERALALARVPEQLANSSDTAVGRMWVNGGIVANECYAALGGSYGEFVGTAFVARDMMRIVDALQEDGLLKYWGFTYGTLLGATVASMFPDRMDKVILDGVVNPFEYYNSFNEQQLDSTDAAAAGYFSGCVQQPEYCALSALNITTAEELEEEMYNFFESLKQEPIAAGSILIDYSTGKKMFFQNLYNPNGWAAFSELLLSLYTRDATVLAELGEEEGESEPTTTESDSGIRCGDMGIGNYTFEELKEVYENSFKTSRWAGDMTYVADTICAQWKMAAAERYEGDFKPNTKNPILIIGNSYDPITPLVSAQNLTETIPGSVLVHQKGYGHCSLAQQSACIQEIVQAYLNDGVLPESGTECEVEDVLFKTEVEAGAAARRSAGGA